MNTGTEQAERLVDIMMCSHTSKRISSDMTICNQCGLVFNHAGTLRGVIRIMIKIGQDIAMDITTGRFSRKSICTHPEKEYDHFDKHGGGTPFCTSCGLVFEDETIYPNGYLEDVNHHPTYEYKNNTNTYNTKIHNDSHTPRPREKEAISTHNVKDIPNTRDISSEKVILTNSSTTIPKDKKGLIKLAQERGIKCTTIMSKKKLCEALGIDEQKKPDRILLTNTDTGEEHRFISTYQASKEMGASSTTIRCCIGRDIIINEAVYSVSEI